MHKLQEPNVARKILGGVFTFVSLVNFGANTLWLYTGNIHRPQVHFTMRGGWEGFMFTTALACITGALGLYLLFTKEPAGVLKNKTELSKEEKESLKAWQSRNISIFVFAWILYIAVILFFPSNYFALSLVTLLFAYGAVMMFMKMCPNCGYRLAYHNQFILPAHCPKCGIALK